jgi:hypothetical protein
MQACKIWGTYGMVDENEIEKAFGEKVTISNDWKESKYPLNREEKSCAIMMGKKRAGTAYSWVA